MPEISIIIRTKNEEKWIPHCLGMIFSQDYEDFEVILVDNKSTDNTVKIAKRYPLNEIIEIDEFIPGKALNDGIRVSSGKYIVCISAHCVPKDKQWLSNLLNNFSEDKKLAGVYGRQLPVSFTEAVDKRDLMITFGLDRRKQIKDFFFHNANSIIPRAVWEKFPFDEEVTNIEDRVWGKAVIDAGYHIIYDPEPAVYHHHGLHQNNDSKRVKGVVSIIEQVDGIVMQDLPDSLRPENIKTTAILLVKDRPKKNTLEIKLLFEVIEELKKAAYVNEIVIVSFEKWLAETATVAWLDREKLIDEDRELDSLLMQTLNFIETDDKHPDAVLYVNHHYPFRPEGLFDEIIVDAQYKGYDCVFPGFVDYGHYWYMSEKEGFKQIDPSMASRNEREPVMRALYGLGCFTTAGLLHSGKMVGGKIGILPIQDFHFNLNIRENGAENIVNNIFEKYVGE
jgi:rhamnosyltransferase